MSDSWQLLLIERDTAAGQMAVDEELARAGRPTFRLFRWRRPAFSLGWKQRRPGWMDPSALEREGIELVERPTGGGLAVHGSDLSCSVVVPHASRVPLQELMARMGESVARACRAFANSVIWQDEATRSRSMVHCLTEPSPYAVMIGERKVCGFAIRRYSTSWLIQGSLLVRRLPDALLRVMPAELQEQFQARAISLEAARGGPVADADLIHELWDAWRTTWDLPGEWASSGQEMAVESLAQAVGVIHAV